MRASAPLRESTVPKFSKAPGPGAEGALNENNSGQLLLCLLKTELRPNAQLSWEQGPQVHSGQGRDGG